MESKLVAPEKMEDVVHALMEILVFPRLSRISSTSTPSFDEHKAVATQMHAVVLLYNYYLRKQKPDLMFLDFASFCDLAVQMKQSLAPFIKLTNGSESQFSLTEKAIKNACDIAAALDASTQVPDTQAWPISKVAVLLIDSIKENCKLQFGAVTEGVWSLFEKDLDDSIKPSRQKAGDKRKRDDVKALNAGYDVVREITGTESNELVVLGSDVTYSLKQEKSATQFYLIQLPKSGTISPKEQVPLKCLVDKLEGPLAEKAFGTWSTTEVVNYYHMLPYVGFISRWLSGKDLCSSIIHSGTPQSTIKSYSNLPIYTNVVNDSEHTDNDSFGKSTQSSDETGKKCKRPSDRDESVLVHKIQSNTDHIDKNANQRRDNTKKNSRSIIKLVKDMNERENGKKLDKDDDVVLKYTKPYVSPVSSIKEVRNDDQHKVFQAQGCCPINDTQNLCNKCDIVTVLASKYADSPNILLPDKGETEDCPSPYSEGLQCVTDTSPSNSGQGGTTTSKKLSSRVGIYHHRRQHNISSSTQIDNNHDGTTWNMESVHNLKNSKDTGCRNGKVPGESEIAISSAHIQNRFSANTNKPADHDQLCQIEDSTKHIALESELENALSLLCTKREKLFSQICRMEDTLVQYEDCIERIRDGGEVGLARRCIESIISGNNHWMLKNETQMQDKDNQSKSQSGKQSSKRLSGISVPSKCHFLEYMCLKNNWRLPRYLVEPAEGKFRSNVVVVVCKDFKVASKGSLESSPSEARESAAAQMIAKICYETEESRD